MRPPGATASSVAGSAVGDGGGASLTIPSVRVPPALATSKNRLLAFRVPSRVRSLPLTRTRSPLVTVKSWKTLIALPVPSRLTLPLTPPLLVIELAVIVLVDASATGPVDVISMTPPVCPSLALPVNSTPPAPAFSTTPVPATELPGPMLILPAFASIVTPVPPFMKAPLPDRAMSPFVAVTVAAALSPRERSHADIPNSSLKSKFYKNSVHVRKETVCFSPFHSFPCVRPKYLMRL